jgi:oxygen-independent coproporphyrinogen-3 oxidase
VYTDRLWQGADMVGLGVSSFGHVNGVHIQNVDTWEAYIDRVDHGLLPLSRAYRPTLEERMIREFVLQLKLGSIRPAYFAERYGVDLLNRFQAELEKLQASGDVAEVSSGAVRLTRQGLLRVDTLLPNFFLPQHRGIRYT